MRYSAIVRKLTLTPGLEIMFRTANACRARRKKNLVQRSQKRIDLIPTGLLGSRLHNHADFLRLLLVNGVHRGCFNSYGHVFTVTVEGRLQLETQGGASGCPTLDTVGSKVKDYLFRQRSTIVAFRSQTPG